MNTIIGIIIVLLSFVLAAVGGYWIASIKHFEVPISYLLGLLGLGFLLVTTGVLIAAK